MHGTRRWYQIWRCRCADCRAANRAYQASYRQALRTGRPPLGVHVAGAEAHQTVAALIEEDWTPATIAAALGYVWPRLQFGAGVTLRTTLRLRRLQREWTA